MQRFLSSALVMGALLFSQLSHAGDIQVEDAWAYATPAGRTSANVYFYITSKQGDTLQGASSAVAQSAALRSMVHNTHGMSIIDVRNVELPANQRVDMTSEHSNHITLLNLKAPLKAGQTVPITLDISKQKVTVQVSVKAHP